MGHELLHVPCNPPRAWLWAQLYRVALKLNRPFTLDRPGPRIREELRRCAYDVMWVDKGIAVAASTLERARRAQPGMRLVSFSADDMTHRHHNSVRYLASLPHYDLHVTTKSRNVGRLAELGARDVLFVDNGYDTRAHRPWSPDGAGSRRFAADVGFVGTYERSRADAMLRLAEHGVPVRVWGHHWRRYRRSHSNLVVECAALSGDDYAKAISATRVNLAFLRKAYADLQTTRSVEIPACGGFMLAERTEEHRRLFEEGREAEFFDSFDELLRKCRHYLEHEEQRARIALAGRQRCLDGGYSNAERLAGALDYLLRERPSRAS